MKKQPPVLLSFLNGGIQRKDSLAEKNQCVDALDVIANDGELRRRDGMRNRAAVPPHLQPCGRTVLVTGLDGTLTTRGNRTLTLGSACDTLYIGGDAEFSAIDWRKVIASDLSTVTDHKRLEVSFWDGAVWSAIPAASVLDTTRELCGPEGSEVWQPLSRDGQITWHPSHVSGWERSSINSSAARYFVRLRILEMATGDLVPLDGTLSIVQPGLKVGTPQPVRNIFALNIGNRPSVVVSHDKQNRQGIEAGAALSLWDHKRTARIRQLNLTSYEGAGQVGVADVPNWSQGTDPAAAPTVQLGADDRLYNWDAEHDFTVEGLFGSPIYTDIQASVIMLPGSISSSALSNVSSYNRVANALQHCYIVVTTGGGGGPAAGEYAEIDLSSSADTAGVVGFYPALSAAPVSATRFAIYRPPARCGILQARESYCCAQDTAALMMLGVLDASATAPLANEFDPANELEAGEQVHFSVERELRWLIQSAPRWSSAYDPVTKQLMLCNGNSGLLAFDGERLRRAEADTTSIDAQTIAAIVPQLPAGTLAAGSIDAQLRSAPPSGKYVVDFNGRLVVAGLVDRPYDIVFSAPGTSNNIWPKAYSQQVRDGQNSPISGLASLYDRLIVFTPTSMHEGVLSELGVIQTRPLSQGVGFSSHHGVSKLVLGRRSVLIGPNPDGIATCDGTEVEQILPAWDELIEGGVNVGALANSVGCAWNSEGLYLVAVAPSGSSQNTRIAIYDRFRECFWLWSCPFGVSSMASTLDSSGKEQLLIGTDDGFIMTFANCATDAGTEVEGYAKSPSMMPFGAIDFDLNRLCVTGKILGSSESLGLSLFLNRRRRAHVSGDFPASAGLAAYDDTAARYDYSRYADESYKTFVVNVPSGTKANALQYEVRSTARFAIRAAEADLRLIDRRMR